MNDLSFFRHEGESRPKLSLWLKREKADREVISLDLWGGGGGGGTSDSPGPPSKVVFKRRDRRRSPGMMGKALC